MRLLAVDDDKEITDTISFYCDQMNIEYKIFNTGREGSKAIRREHFDLILLDLAMPDISGLDIVNSLNEEGLLASKNIVIMTGSSDIKKLFEIRKFGVKGIYKKPGSLEELTEVIERHRPKI